jgi:hypothetical protein
MPYRTKCTQVSHQFFSENNIVVVPFTDDEITEYRDGIIKEFYRLKFEGDLVLTGCYTTQGNVFVLIDNNNVLPTEAISWLRENIN